MKKLLLAATTIIAGFALSSAAMAQTATDATVPGAETNIGGTEPTNIPGHGRVDEIDQRDDNQQNAINKGVADGQLTQGQAARDQAHLDAQEANQAQQEADHGGHLTGQEQRQDNGSLNGSNSHIQNQRGVAPSETTVGGHEATHIPGHGRVDEIDRRDNRQQRRINQGLADGQLSKAQAAHDDARLHRQEAQQKSQEAHNGGHLTKAEQRNDNKWLNKSSSNIHQQRKAGARREHK